MDHPSSRQDPKPIWSDEILDTNPDHDEEEEDESTDDDKDDGKKGSVSQLGSSPPRKKRIVGLSVRDQDQPPSQPKCQVQKCTEDLTGLKQYHRRHKICGYHAKALFAIVAGLRQRFCQQCSRFHELHEFDDKKRSCRRRLAGHNERRRKSSSSVTLGSRRLCVQLKENQFIHEGERGRG